MMLAKIAVTLSHHQNCIISMEELKHGPGLYARFLAPKSYTLESNSSKIWSYCEIFVYSDITNLKFSIADR